MSDLPSVLFVCVHNAGRSQMAAGFLTHLGGNSVEVRSAGSAPAESINSAAVEAMAELRRFVDFLPASNLEKPPVWPRCFLQHIRCYSL